MLADYHMHTHHSNDSSYKMEDLVVKAIQEGIDEICLTEHSDYGPMGDYVVNYDNYYKEYLLLKEKYKDKIKIKFGCEFGMQEHTIQQFQRDFNIYPFDFIILSNHQIGDKEFWTQEYQKGKSQEEYNRGYYEAIYNVITQYKDYSVLGHLDMIKRYDEIGAYPDQHCLDLIEKILKQVIKDNKGIEVNTSSFRYGLSDLTPSRMILELYYNLGGQIITVGSDTHSEEHVGYKIQDIYKVLKEIGFEYICTFDRMKENYVKIS